MARAIMIATTLSALREEQFSEELQFNIDAFAGRLKSVLGLYYFQEKNENLENAYLSEGLGQFYGPYRNDNKSYAAYTHNSLSLTDKLSLTLGARYTTDKKTFNAGQSDINLSLLKLGLFTAGQLPDPSDPTRLYPLGTQRDTYNNFSCGSARNTKIDRDIMIYGSFAQGFKSGGYTTRLSIPTPGNVPPRFNPEKADTFRGRREAPSSSTAASSSTSRRSTPTTRTCRSSWCGASRRSSRTPGRAKIDGFELEMVARPDPEVRLNGSLGYIHARYSRARSRRDLHQERRFREHAEVVGVLRGRRRPAQGSRRDVHRAW